jgi:hypothetical protein
METNDVVLIKLSKEMNLMTRLLAYNAIKDEKTITDKAVILDRLGLSLSENAIICGTSAKAVSVRLAESRRKKKPDKSADMPTV